MSHRNKARGIISLEDVKKWSCQITETNEYRLAVIRTLNAHCEDPCRPCYQCNNTRTCPFQTIHATLSLFGIADKAVWEAAVNWSFRYFSKHPRP